MKRMNKKAQGGIPILGLLLLGLFLAGGIVGGFFLVSKFTGGEALSISGTEVGDDGRNKCIGGETQSLTLTGVNTETSEPIVGTSFAYRKVGNTAWSTGTYGTAITALETGADYEVVPGVTVSTEQGFPYGKKFTIENLPCVMSKEIELYNDTLYTDVTATFYNEDNNAAAQTLGASDTAVVKLKFSAGTNEYAGNPTIGDLPNVICCNMNTTAYNKFQYVKYDGKDLTSVGAPSIHGAEAGHTSFCYEAPVLTEEDLWITFKLDTKAEDPAIDDTCSFYTGSYYIHSTTGDVETGVETDDGNFVGFSAADTVNIDVS